MERWYNLSSDAGLLLIKEFVSKLGIDKLFVKSFKTNDSALFRYHTDQENLLQMIYMIIAGYFEDAEDCCKSSSFSKIYHIQAV